jgi:hypothetical protein
VQECLCIGCVKANKHRAGRDNLLTRLGPCCVQVDWDYHMRLILLGLVGGDPSEQGSIIHFYHFRHWRMHGVAYELRDSEYDQPNRTMITTALGRTKEFKDRWVQSPVA